ncbi:MAG: corrinoid protein [Candidatus Latescibacteria bacterium]|nr:corrinoid protein [Candidatus Latescibacterota bacterium]
MEILSELSQAVIVGNREKAVALTTQALDAGTAPVAIINEGLIPGMGVVGEKFKCNEYYIPNVLIAARAMQAAMGLVKPLLAEGELQYKGKGVIGTVKGDLHDIGKNLVCMMMEGAGFQMKDLGVDVSPEKFASEAEAMGANLILISALLTTTMVGMRDVVSTLEARGLRGKVKVMIGGAPITQRFADEIGADGYAPDAGSAVDTAKELLGVAA